MFFYNYIITEKKYGGKGGGNFTPLLHSYNMEQNIWLSKVGN